MNGEGRGRKVLAQAIEELSGKILDPPKKIDEIIKKYGEDEQAVKAAIYDECAELYNDYSIGVRGLSYNCDVDITEYVNLKFIEML